MRWSGNLAYVVGLLATDGNLSKDQRHIDLTSKDYNQIKTFAGILRLSNKIGFKKSSYNPTGVYYRIQFGNVKFYRFLVRIGLTSNKTKTIGVLKIPDKYFSDFLRGHFDGDGYEYSYWDKRWRSSFRLYTAFTSASRVHLEWIEYKIRQLYGAKGVIRFKGKSTFELSFSKKASVILLGKMYYKDSVVCLKRKHSKIMEALSIIGK